MFLSSFKSIIVKLKVSIYFQYVMGALLLTLLLVGVFTGCNEVEKINSNPESVDVKNDDTDSCFSESLSTSELPELENFLTPPSESTKGSNELKRFADRQTSETLVFPKVSDNSISKREERKTESIVQPKQNPVEEEKPAKTIATAKDSKAMAEKLIEYLNEYRVAQGSPPAAILTEYIPYAEYRSRQLVSHFAHDTVDEREAATVLKIGTYVNPADYGMDGDPYYSADVREAIAMTGYVGTVEEVAKNLADLIRNSVDHWAYGGSAEYTQIAVGVTCAANGWDVDIAMKN